jgi:uncharacterized protein
MLKTGTVAIAPRMTPARVRAKGKPDSLTRKHATRPHGPLKISNLTRLTELAGRVAVADSGATRRKGLLGRAGLDEGEGLWIVPCEAVHTFKMRFALDLVFVDRKLRVKKIKSNVRPWRLAACLSAHSVIELAAGTILRTQTQAGDCLAFAPALEQSIDAVTKSDN